MADAVRAVLAGAGGPARLRAELLRRARPLAALRRAIAGAAALGAALPSALIDGGLASVLSERLRTLLRAPTAPEPDAVGAGRAAPGPGPAPARSGPPRAAAAAPQAFARHADGTGHGAAAAVRLAAARHAAAPAPAAASLRTEALEGDGGTAAPGRAPDAARRVERTGVRPWAPPSPAAPPRGAPVTSLLALLLREYRALEARRVERERGARLADEAGAARASREAAGRTAEPAGRGLEPPGLPPAPGRAAARRRPPRAQRPGEDAARGAAAPAAAPRDGAGPVQIRNEFRIAMGDDFGADDLADRIAAILREQALQHGIDLT